MEEKEEYNIQLETKELVKKFEKSQDVEKIVETIAPYSPETIVSFGNEVAEEIAKCSDNILNSMNISEINETGEMLNILSKIMDKFNIEEIQQKPGFFQKIFGNVKKQLEKIVEKYHTLGNEVDKIYIKLKEYENEIKKSNEKLENMFQTNMKYYKNLIQYILAGEQGIKELKKYIEEKIAEFNTNQDKSLQLDLNILNQSKELLEQRVQDLRIAENVAMQSIPMLKTMQYSNANLIRKINSAFIITLPIFKQALSQAILLKRQGLQAEALSVLDKKTNEMLLKNAQTTVEQSKLAAQLSTGSSIKIETLETTWKAIVKGIEETRKIQEEASKKREEDQKRLANIKEEFKKIINI